MTTPTPEQLSAAREWIDQFDASVWAREFVAYVKRDPAIPTDEATMLAWFANAIMAGYDRAAHDARAELAAMRPVVEAAEEWISNPGFDYTQRLIKAIRTYEGGQK